MASDSVVGATTIIRGNLRGAGSLEVLGRLEGDLQLRGDVTVGEGGVIKGDLVGARVSIAGSVQGNIEGTEAVLVAQTARIVGDLKAPQIAIASGAMVRGHLLCEGEASAGEPALRSVPEPPGSTSELSPDRPSAAATPTSTSPRAPAPAVEHSPAPPPVMPALGRSARGKRRSKPS